MKGARSISDAVAVAVSGSGGSSRIPGFPGNCGRAGVAGSGEGIWLSFGWPPASRIRSSTAGNGPGDDRTRVEGEAPGGGGEGDADLVLIDADAGES